MSRIGLREIRRPNIKGATFAVESPSTGIPTGSDKPTTKLQQTAHKAPTEPTTKLQQTHNKVTPRGGEEAPSSNETYNKLPTQPTTQPTTKLQQSYNEPTTKRSFLALVGLQRGIVLFVYELCRQKGARITEAVSISNIAATCETTVRAAQETIRRLEQKRFIHRAEFKNGRGGWTSYELPEGIYKELFQLETSNKLTTKLQQTSNKLPTELTTQPTTPASSSSSSIEIENFKTTTTSEVELFENQPIKLSPEWVNLDLSGLAIIGFTQTHLIQIIRQAKLSPEEVQDSIDAFSFDLRRNGKARTITGAPLNYFMGILRRGIVYAPPENYESPAAEAKRKTLEVKRAQAEKHAAVERELQDLEFSEWKRGLSESEISALCPEYARRPGPLQDSALKTYFENQIWPEKQAAHRNESEQQQIRAVVTQALGEVRG